ncbi:transient receptor potential cation channel,subfamily m, member, putative [Schistosoma mansoni]|uniref:transient receptor potential cation channel,subfamily m, member, putative n=1 Tax=Schistosoma mansoni TaxID=6183 RepID=UPI0001A61DCE|nr:transient receptor potential cation channel,subfamily m, member, putative [Schistosoma mansoni]|eukprot:XP_018645452.1 transient receptor potential cation channel,subfamily m, member, putative [Schistosoma mansoni]
MLSAYELSIFCKLNSETPDSILRDILKRKWGLKPPTLIITVFGTDFEKKRKLKMIFKKGLWKAAESGCWIVTGGFHLGVMKLTGEAVRDYTDAYGGNRMMAFGVATVYQSEEDEEEEAEDSEPILVDPLSQGGIKSVRSDIEERALDPNHNFFVLVDDGTTDQLKGKEAELRARFERCISLWNCASSPQEQTTTVTSQQSGPISSTTHLQQPQNGISTSSNVNNNVNLGGLQRQGSTMGGQASTTSGPQTSATSIGKTSAITGGSSSNSALSKGVSEPVVSNQPVSTASVTRGTKDKLTTESSLKPAKSGKSVGSEEEILVPMCGLVVGGDRFTLRQVYCSMIRNRCPIVVTKGTSGAADVLAFGLDAANKMASEEVVDDKDQVPLEARLESIIEEFLGDLHPDYTNYTDEVNMLCEIINEYTNLVSVFDMEEDSDLDGYVISSLLASAGSTVASDQINLEQLEITLTLNRADIAREKIFLENKKWKTSKVALRDVGKVIKALVGDFYHPLYLSKEFQAKLMPEKRLEGADFQAHP